MSHMFTKVRTLFSCIFSMFNMLRFRLVIMSNFIRKFIVHNLQSGDISERSIAIYIKTICDLFLEK